MKKILHVGVLSLALLLAAATAQAQMRFGFRAFGGLNYVGGGDLQKALKNTADSYGEFYDALGLNKSGDDYQAFHLGMNFGGEIMIQFSPSMAFGLGAGYINASSTTEAAWSFGSVSFDEIWKPNASAIPITLSFYYSLPMGSQMNLVAHLGAGYYLSTLKLEDAWWFIVDIEDGYDLKASGIGFHGGIGLEFAVSPMFSIMAELRGRFANIRGFEGDWTMSVPALGFTDTMSGTLFYYREDGGDWYYFDETEPSGGSISDVREMGVDFSGFSFVIGALVRF